MHSPPQRERLCHCDLDWGVRGEVSQLVESSPNDAMWLHPLSRGRSLVLHPDSRSVQGVFVGLLALDLLLRATAGSRASVGAFPPIAFGVALTLLAICLLVRPLPAYCFETFLVLDLAVLGLSRLAPEAGSTGLLVVLPALWLGRLLGHRGAAVAVVATVLLVVTPSLLVHGASGGSLSRSVMIPVVAAFASLAVSDGIEEVLSRQAEAGRRGQELALALDLIEHQRRVADAIMDSVDIGLVLLDRDGAYAGINRRHEDFMRLAYPDGHAGRAGQTGEVWAEDGSTLVGRDGMPTYRAACGEEFDDSRIWVGRDSNDRRALSVSARTVRDDDGSFAGAALAYKDVTDFMRSLDIKDQFVASVSHELRTPLTSILGYVQLLEDRDDLPAGTLEMLGIVERNAERLRRLITDLLDTAQLEDGSMAVVRAPGDLVAIVRESVQAVAPAAHAAGISVELTTPDELVVPVDTQRFAQVVDNLLSNAVKYTGPGGSVRVRLSRDVQRAELEVSDTGIGIDAADRDRLFSRFFRSADAEHRTIPGIGLGLAISKGIIEAHGGRIEVDSEPGKGSVFRVRLPLASS